MTRPAWLRDLFHKFAFNWRAINFAETFLAAEDVVILRRRISMNRIKNSTIKLARKRGITLTHPYAFWKSEARHLQNSSIDESHFHVLVLCNSKHTIGRFSDLWLVRFADGEQYAMKAIDEMERMISVSTK